MRIDEIICAPVQGQGYTVLTPGLGGLVSNYALQPPLTPRTTMVKAADGVAHFPVKGKTVAIPFAPFLGTIGVAPRGEKRLSYFQGADFLGNVDLPFIGPPNTLVLPVHVDGALLSLGDAHVAQGDGEISGAAIENQADVRLFYAVVLYRLDDLQNADEQLKLVDVNALTSLQKSEADIEREYLDPTALKRMVSEEDVAATALFLASDEAASISGETISVSGGFRI